MKLHEVKTALLATLNRLSEREEGWAVDDHNREALRIASEWLHASDFRKGIALRGPVGTGKSKIIEAMGLVIRGMHGKGIRRIEAVELVNAVARAKGDRSVLEKYADHQVYPHLCIEDLDTEGNAPSFVTGDGGINCVAELIQVRYKRWEQGLPLTTYFTTNADNDRLFTRYGERCVSRMAHMTRVVPLPGPDRRAQSVLPASVEDRNAYVAPAPEPISNTEVAAAVHQFKEGHTVARMDAEAKAAKRRAEYLDDMRARVHRMTLLELHTVIQNDAHPEARAMARNKFDAVAPISYAAFVQQLADAA